MSEFVEQDLEGSHFERTSLRNAIFRQVHFNDATMRRVDFSSVDIRGALFRGTRMIGVEFVDVEISGGLQNVIVNGIDIAPLVEHELNRLYPDRVKVHPKTVAEAKEGWAIVRRLWDETIAKASGLPAETLHARVNGEWSFIQTLRHLNFASAAWIDRMIVGNPSPWHALDLPWDEAPGWDGIPWDRDARPTLTEVLAVRRDREATMSKVIESLTDEQFASRVTRTEPGWPQMTDFPLQECVSIVLSEQWEHNHFAERDLAALTR